MNKLQLFATRHSRYRRRLLLWAGGLLSLYTLLGFVLVPWLAERQLLSTLRQRLGATAAVNDIDFNPFTFTASIDALDVQAADGTALLSLGRLYVNLEPSRFLLLKLRLADVSLDTLELHYTRYAPADDTLTRLAQQWAATAAPAEPEEVPAAETQADAEPFPLEIGRLQVLNSSIHYRDEVPQTAFETTVGPLAVDIANVSTLNSAEPGTANLVLQIEQDATLTWTSSVGLIPLHFNGHVDLNNFSLTTPWRYFQDTLPFELSDGRLTAGFDYTFSTADPGPRVNLSNFALQISALSARESVTNSVFLSGGTLALDNGSFTYPDLRAQAAALRIDGMDLHLLRNEQGVLNLQAMLNSFSADPDPDTDTDLPLQLTLDELLLADTTLTFTDQSTSTPATLSVEARAGLQDFTLAPNMPLPFAATLRLASGGTLVTEGSVQLFPVLDLDASLELSELTLLPVQPYLDEFAQVTLERATLAASTRLRSTADETLAVQGNLTLSDLELSDQQRGETLFSLDALRVAELDLALDARRLEISELVVDALYGRVVIDETGTTNVGEAFTAAGAGADVLADSAIVDSGAQSAPPVAADSDPFAISLGRLLINGASSDFTDRSLPIVFNTRMTTLDGELSGFSSASSQAMRIALEGQVNEYGLVEISGALNPFDLTRQTRVELEFTNLELPAMTPYVIKFAGREIAEGTLNVALAYTVEDSTLQATNAVTIRGMRLGDRVDYPDARDLPLDLAVALLKNGDDVIDLNIPVTGNLDDPQFDLGPVIRRAVFNAITGIVTSPFRLLGNLIGGDADQIDRIRFRPGRSDLAPPEQQTLQRLLQALAQRPQLALLIPAPFAAAEDTQALKARSVDARIETRIAQDAGDATLPERRLAVLESLYAMAALSPAVEEVRQPFVQSANEDAEPQLDTLAYSAALRERLVEVEPVSEQQLRELARARQTAVSAYLLENGALTAQRLRQQDVETAELEDGWLTSRFEVGVSE